MIARLAAFRRRAPADRALVIRTVTLFLCAHVLLRLTRLDQVRTAMARVARRAGACAQNAAQLGWAVAAVDRHLPGRHSCLIHAVCCEAIAVNSGIAIEFRIGAARAGTTMQFHAWVEHGGLAITGEPNGAFVPLG